MIGVNFCKFLFVKSINNDVSFLKKVKEVVKDEIVVVKVDVKFKVDIKLKNIQDCLKVRFKFNFVRIDIVLLVEFVIEKFSIVVFVVLVVEFVFFLLVLFELVVLLEELRGDMLLLVYILFSGEMF